MRFSRRDNGAPKANQVVGSGRGLRPVAVELDHGRPLPALVGTACSRCSSLRGAFPALPTLANARIRRPEENRRGEEGTTAAGPARPGGE